MQNASQTIQNRMVYVSYEVIFGDSHTIFPRTWKYSKMKITDFGSTLTARNLFNF